MKHYLIAGSILLILLITAGCRKDNGALFTAEDFVATIDEDPLAGAEIGTINATTNGGTLSYSVKSSSVEGAFTVNESGVVTVADSTLFDYETNPTIIGVITLECEGEQKNVNVTIVLNNMTYYAGIRDLTGLMLTSHSANYLLGTRDTLFHSGILVSLNLIGNNSGGAVQMALYADNNGVPGTLVAVSETGTVGDGETSLDVDPVNISAGLYWIMTVYETDGHHTYWDQAYSVTAYYTELTYGSSIPSDASSFTGYSDHDFAYSITVE